MAVSVHHTVPLNAFVKKYSRRGQMYVAKSAGQKANTCPCYVLVLVLGIHIA